MTVLGFFPGMQWSDPKTGQLTADAQRLMINLVQANNGEGAAVTVDGIQTLTNKTIDGDTNTLSDIETNSLKSRSGDANTVVTGDAGTAGTLMVWGSEGDATEGPEAILLLTTETAAENYLPLNGDVGASGPIVLASYTVATVPSAATYPRGLIYVSDEAGGAIVAFSTGTDWRRVTDRAVIS